LPTKSRIQVYVDTEVGQELDAKWKKDKETLGYALSFSEWLEKKFKEWLELERGRNKTAT